ncbi:hypothetical protein ES703_61576 [subsurface metagenome]
MIQTPIHSTTILGSPPGPQGGHGRRRRYCRLMDMVITEDPSERRRRSIRLKGYDYAQPGAYFVTMCTHRWEQVFGKVINGKMALNQYGEIIEDIWWKINAIRPYVTVDRFVVMPNHVHGIIMIHDRPGNVEIVGATQWVAPTEEMSKSRGPAPNSLGTIIGQFKSAATKRINCLRSSPSWPVWQRNYFEHIIRDDKALNRILEYIHYNPQRWRLDKYNPTAIEPDEFDGWLGGVQ